MGMKQKMTEKVFDVPVLCFFPACIMMSTIIHIIFFFLSLLWTGLPAQFSEGYIY